MIDVDLPDGRTISVDTDDPKVAASAAKKFMGGASPAPDKPAGWDAPGGEAPLRDRLNQRFDASFREGRDILGTLGMQGATGGFSDEIAGGLSYLAGRGYQAGRDAERARVKAAEDKAGSIGAGAAELAGSLVPFAGLSRVIGPGQTLLSQIGRGAAVGAGTGAAYGFGKGEGEDGRLLGAGVGAATGGILGTATPLIVRGAMALASAPSKIANMLRTPGPERDAQQRLMQAFERDGVNESEALLRLQNWQQSGAKPEVLADLGGENVRSLAAAAARVPGPGKETAQNFARTRRAEQSSRINEDLMALSPNRDYYGTADAMDALKARAEPLYKQAFAANKAVVSPEIDKILATPDGRRALTAAAETMQNSRSRMGLPDEELADQVSYLVAKGAMEQPKGGVAAGLNLRSLDLVKQELWDIAKGKMRTTPFGAEDTTASRATKGLYADLVKALDDADITAQAGPNSVKAAGGLYKQARQMFAEPARAKDALDAGRNAILKDAEITAANLAEMSAGEKELFRAGMARAIIDKVKGTPDGADAIKRFFGNELTRERISAAFPSRAAYDRFAAQMEREASMASLEGAISPRTGSQTTPLAWAGADQAAGAAMSLARGDVGGAGMAVLRGLLARSRPQTMSPEAASSVVDMATSPASSQRVTELLRELTNRTTVPARRAAIVGELRALSAVPAQNQDFNRALTQ